MNFISLLLSLALCINTQFAWSLSKKHVKSFLRDGFVVIEDAISEKEADQASAGLHESLVNQIRILFISDF
jgi:hypothetical protein